MRVLFATVLLESVVVIVVTRLLCVEFMQFFVTTSILKTTNELQYIITIIILVNISLLFLLRSLERHTIFYVISLFAFCMNVDY